MGINKGGKTFTKGDICVYEEKYSMYKFVMYLNTNMDGTVSVLDRSDPTQADTTIKNIPQNTLWEFSKAFGPKQNYKQNEINLDENALLETYVINKN